MIIELRVNVDVAEKKYRKYMGLDENDDLHQDLEELAELLVGQFLVRNKCDGKNGDRA